MITKRLALSVIAIVILTSIVVYSADAAGIPKKAISTVSRFIESDLPTTTLFTDVQNTITSIQQFTTTSAVFENPAKTFGTTLSGGAVTANRTLNLPAITGTDTLGALGMTQSWTGVNTFTGNNVFTGSNDFGISGGTDKFDNAGIIIRNPAHSFTTTLSNPAITANRTLNLPLITGTDTLGALGMTQSWTGNNTMKFGAGGIIVRNPASTFGTTIINSAITANRTLILPLTIATETIAVNPETNFTTGHTAGNSTKTTSTTRTMLGNYATLTPQVTGNIRVTVSGLAHASLAGGGCVIDIRASTSNMGANGAALTGTILGSNMKITSPTAAANMTFTKIAVITGLTPNTKEFFDLSFARLGASNACFITNVDWLLQEY